MSDGRRDETRRKAGKDLSQDERNVIYTGLRWGGAMDRLEPQWDVVYHDEECTTKAEGKQGPE